MGEAALASDVQSAWSLIQVDEFDIVFAGLRMPVRSGQELDQLVNGFSPDLAKKMDVINCVDLSAVFTCNT